MISQEIKVPLSPMKVKKNEKVVGCLLMVEWSPMRVEGCGLLPRFRRRLIGSAENTRSRTILIAPGAGAVSGHGHRRGHTGGARRRSPSWME